ncbi:MAG: DUF6056 family protein [Erysipelotrichales bacterium]|nr:DUF6056 family protein [Erysipelotrichales bacterium]
MILLSKIEEMYTKNKKIIDLFLLFFVIFSYIFALYTSVFKLDDLIYMNKWESVEPIKTLSDIFQYQVKHYYQWGGRTIAHTILQLLFLLPKIVSASLIALCFVSLSVLIYKIAFINKKIDWLIVILIMSLLYFFNPAPDETLFWYTGISNYLITGMIILLSFYPFVRKVNGMNLKTIHLCLIPISFLAGWCNENMSASLVLMMIIVILYDYNHFKKLDFRLVLSLILAVLGTFLLLLAPGNFARASTFSSGIMSVLYRGHGQVNSWFNWLLLPIITLIATFNTKNKTSYSLSSNILTIWSFLSILAMIASPTYPSRATFGSLLLIIASIIINVKNNSFCNYRRFNFICILFGIGFALTCLSIGILQYTRSLGVFIPG